MKRVRVVDHVHVVAVAVVGIGGRAWGRVAARVQIGRGRRRIEAELVEVVLAYERHHIGRRDLVGVGVAAARAGHLCFLLLLFVDNH